jgi:type II secretory pathway predicted ATPase ExeA
MTAKCIKLEKYVDLSEQSERMQAFYGLKHDPFGALVDAMVFSGAGDRYEVAETIRHLLTYSPQDGLVIGREGSGKRTLVQHVLKMLEEHWRIAWVDGSEIDSSDALLKEIVGQLGLGLKVDLDVQSVIAQINQTVAERTVSGEAFLLVVQFSDQMDDSLRSLIENFRIPNQLDNRLRQLWLMSSQDSMPDLRDDDWFSYPLSNLSDDDAELYLKDRLVAAGNVGELPFSQKDISRLNQMSKGSLTALNELARDYLIGTTFRTAEKTKGFPLTHVIAGIAALTIVSIALLYNLNEKKGATTKVEIPNTNLPLSSVQQKLADAVAKVEAKAQQQTQLLDSANTDSVSNDTAESNVESTDSSSDQNEGGAELPETELVAAAADDSSSSEGANEVASLLIEAPQLSLFDRAEDQQFTMQLIGVHDRIKLDSVIAEFVDPSLVDVVETQYEGKPWFVLIYGEFETKAEAQQAISALPKSFEKQTPWIRTFAAIRQAVVK